MTKKMIYANVGPFGTTDESVHTRYEIKNQDADAIRKHRAETDDPFLKLAEDITAMYADMNEGHKLKFEEIFERLDVLRENTEQLKRAVDYLAKRNAPQVWGVRRNER